MSKQGFYVTGGDMPCDARSYVERQADNALYESLREGKFCYVLDSRQIGKSSLKGRVSARLAESGVCVTTLDLQTSGQSLGVEQWYFGLLYRIGQQFRIEDELEKFWLDHPLLGPLQRWMNAIIEVVLPRCPGRLVIFVDEIDAARSLPFKADEFFAGIREFHNRRTAEPELERLTFCLLGAATPSDLITDPRTTPFNIGQRVELYDFTEGEASSLTEGLGRDKKTGNKLLKRIFYWTNGHPYLTQRLCQSVAENATVKGSLEIDRLCKELFFTPQGQKDDLNLPNVSARILMRDKGKKKSDEELAALLDYYKRILGRKRVKDDQTNPLIGELKLSGIIGVNDGSLRVRNRIYEQVFGMEWVKENMPGAELRRQRAAFRRGALRAAAGTALIVALIATLAVVAIQQRDLARAAAKQADRNAEETKQAFSVADQQRQLAEEERTKADRHLLAAVNQKLIADSERERAEDQLRANQRLLYLSNMTLAVQAMELRGFSRAQELLDSLRPKPGQEDLRGFDWYYLWQLCHNDLVTLHDAGKVNSIALSPDGKRLASGSWDGTVKLWDVATGRELVKIEGYSEVRQAVSPTAFITQGQITIKESLETITSVAFSPDGKKLASGSSDGTVKLWDAATGRELLPLKRHSVVVTSVAFSPNGKRLASGSSDETVNLWDVATGQELLTLKGHSGQVLEVAFSPDGKRLASGSEDKTVKLWDATTGQDLLTLKGHSGQVRGVAFSPDGKKLASGSSDGTVKLWDAITGQELLKINGHSEEVAAVAFSPDGKKLASGSSDKTVKLWDVATGQLLLQIEGHSEWVTSVAFTPDGKRLASGSWDKTVKLWDIATSQELLTVEGHSDTFINIAFSPDGKRLASGYSDGTLRLWDVATCQELLQIKGHSETVTVAFSPDGKKLASGSRDKIVKLWDVATGQELLQIRGNSAAVLSVAFSPDGKRLASGSRDGTAKLWDATTGQELLKINGHPEGGISVVFSSDGKRLASQSWDGTVKLRDIATGQELLKIDGHSEMVTAVAFSPDGKRLASGSLDKTVKLRDVTTGQELLKIDGHSEQVTAVAFSPDGKRLASGSRDGTVKLWDVATGRELLTLMGRSWVVFSIAFSPDGKRLASGYSDGTVKLWRAATEQEVLARDKVQTGVR